MWSHVSSTALKNQQIDVKKTKKFPREIFSPVNDSSHNFEMYIVHVQCMCILNDRFTLQQCKACLHTYMYARSKISFLLNNASFLMKSMNNISICTDNDAKTTVFLFVFI